MRRAADTACDTSLRQGFVHCSSDPSVVEHLVSVVHSIFTMIAQSPGNPSAKPNCLRHISITLLPPACRGIRCRQQGVI